MIPFAMWTPSAWELGIVLVLVVILFGVGKLPTAFGQLGQAVKNFRDAQKEDPTPESKPKALSESAPGEVPEATEVESKLEV